MSAWLTMAATLVATIASADEPVPPANNANPVPPANNAVSYYQQIRPVFQAQCQGCHQPAKASGKYRDDRFRQAAGRRRVGPRGHRARQAGRELSHRADQGRGRQGRDAQGPAGGVGRRFRADQAVDRAGAPRTIRPSLPPRNTIPSIRPFMPGRRRSPRSIFHPTASCWPWPDFTKCCWSTAESHAVVSRLIGKSDRIESVRFSPDGTRLAVAGGVPAELGEVQVWDVAARKQLLVGADRLQRRLRRQLVARRQAASALAAATATITRCGPSTPRPASRCCFKDAHTDWVRDTTFSVEGRSPGFGLRAT